MKNVILIGMPGCGKSTIGVVLAKVLGYRFIDGDLLIQEQEGKLLSEIIAERGNEGFLEIENQVNRDLQADRSVIYGKEAMEHYQEIGVVVYLKLGYEALCRRLGNLKCRGVVLKEGQTLLDLYEERVPYYEKYAQIVIEEDGLNVEGTLEVLVAALKDAGIGKNA